MKRFLFAAASAVSLLLFIAALSMWARSYRGGEGWIFPDRSLDTPPAARAIPIYGTEEWLHRRRIASSGGWFQWIEWDLTSPDYDVEGANVIVPNGYQPRAIIFSSVNSGLFPTKGVRGACDWSLPGIEYAAVPTSVTSAGIYFGRRSIVAHWALIASAFAMLPVVFATRWWRLRRSIRRRKANRCASCGYDLRASTDRCPECGTPIEANPICRDASA